MSAARDAYGRAFHCGVGGHDGHPGDDFGNLTNESDQVYADRCALAVEWGTLRTYAIALRKSVNKIIKDHDCWDHNTDTPCLNCQTLDDVANEHPKYIRDMLEE